MAKTRRARIDTENDYRRVTRLRLWAIVKETRGYPTGYLRAQSGTIKYDHGSREVDCETAIALHGTRVMGIMALIRIGNPAVMMCAWGVWTPSGQDFPVWTPCASSGCGVLSAFHVTIGDDRCAKKPLRNQSRMVKWHVTCAGGSPKSSGIARSGARKHEGRIAHCPFLLRLTVGGRGGRGAS